MAEQEEISDPRTESFTDKITDRVHGDGDGDVHTSSSSSSSDSEHDNDNRASESSAKENREFRREKPVHKAVSPHIPEVRLPQEPFVEIASGLVSEINHVFAELREISSGRNLKKFLKVVFGLWFFSIVGSCCSFLTLSYIIFVSLHTVPVLYEKYGDMIDPYSQKAMYGIRKPYAVFDSKILSKMPKRALAKKRA
ncbi:hypothetical protein SASPL_102663 [Salvia splendens]|uniref:Reticulon-like protein n=1 Tax=Salvia splendens TaxID=180675 RepID=A0A8X8YWD7_SALSN|nr:hypothetical protein SASPL_102663 [Salvia splendens]